MADGGDGLEILTAPFTAFLPPDPFSDPEFILLLLVGLIPVELIILAVFAKYVRCKVIRTRDAKSPEYKGQKKT